MTLVSPRGLIPLSLLCAIVGSPQLGVAAEGSAAYPVGSSGDFVAAFPPMPGFFYQNTVSYTHASSLLGDDGKKIPGSDYNLSVVADTHRFIASWGEFGGFLLYSQFLVPVVYGDTSLKFGGFDVASGDNFGLGNLAVSPLCLIYQLDEENNVVISYDYFSDIGKYNPKNAFNPATGYASHQPVVAYGHMPQEGLYYALTFRGVFPETNSDTDYRTGNAIASDFKVGWKTGNLSASIVGGYYHQYQDDKGPGVAASGNKTRQLLIGPNITYNLGPAILNANFQTTAYGRNTAKASTFYVSLSVPIGGPPPKME